MKKSTQEKKKTEKVTGQATKSGTGLALANWVEVDFLDRNHPNLISKLSRHTEIRCQIDFERLMVNHIVEYVIEL